MSREESRTPPRLRAAQQKGPAGREGASVEEALLSQELEELVAEILEGVETLPQPERVEGYRKRARVVITGMGALTPLGLTVEETWEGLVAGRSGIGYLSRIDTADLPTKIGGEVKGFDPSLYMDFKEARRMELFSQFAVAATGMALEDGGLVIDETNAPQVGVLIGTAIGGLGATQEACLRYFVEKKRVSPFYLVSMIPNIAAFHVARLYGLEGYNSTVTTACAAGTQAVGEAAEVIRRGAAQVMIAGGTESADSLLGMAGFVSMRVLSTRNDDPQGASRPFDKDRDGLVGSEGCGILVLENLEHALRRGARIYAEVLGYSTTSDAYHMAQPDPEAKGATRAMRWAIADAGLRPEDIDYINAHGTSTVLGDIMETLAIKKALGEHAYKVPISSTKSMIGHLMGGAGAVEAIATALTIYQGVIHPTINYHTPDPQCDLDYVPNVARQVEVRIALSNSFGLGGQDACLVLGRYQV
ncbi:MAG TPA: beta-ketoacyl-[acyl-carrier-protein] synthase II [Chloroflexi bacterium]|nr:beta-ketoacyl-[acyl-carrier-protein] synthase II [Chloroflexota bacterium]